jgi:hypothetical protein
MSDLGDLFISPNEQDRNGESANVVDGLFEISRALNGVAEAIHRLGNAGATTEFGGLEALGMAIERAAHDISISVDAADTGGATKKAIERVVDAIYNTDPNKEYL